MTFNYDNIPQELTNLKRFTLAKGKIPYQLYYDPIKKTNKASSTDPSTWATFGEVLKVLSKNNDYSGIGIMLGYAQEYGKYLACFDFDHVIENENIDQNILDIINVMNTYTEISMSGKGIHVLFFTDKPLDIKHGIDLNNGKHIDIYFESHFIVLTNNIFQEHKTLRTINKNELNEIIGTYLSEYIDSEKDNEPEINSMEKNLNDKLTKEGLTLEKIFQYPEYMDKYPELSKFKKIGKKYYTKNPTHESETGTNFSFDPDKQMWHCWRHGSGGMQIEAIALLENILPCEEIKKGVWKNHPEEFKKILNIIKEKFNINLISNKTNKNTLKNIKSHWYDNKGNLIRENVINSILNKFERIISNNENIYLWLNDHYDEQGREIIAKYIHENAEELSSRTISDLVQEIYNLTFLTKEDLKKMQIPKKFLPVKNGLIDLETFEFLPHTPDYFYTKKLNVIYNPQKLPKNFIEYLLSRFENNYSEMFKVIEDFAVAHLRDNRFQIIPIWMGLSKTETGLVSGEEGKTFTAENIIGRTYFGDELFTKVDVRVLSEKDNEWYTLKDKWWHTISVNEESHILNFAKTIEDLRDPSFQKPIKHAKYQELIENQAYHILIGNTFPPINAQTKAIYRSLKKIVYWKKSIGNDWKYLEKIDENEKSGMLNLALLFIKIIKTRGSLYGLLNINDVPDEYTKISEPLIPILNSIFEKDPNGEIEQHEAYNLVIEKAQGQENIIERLSLAKLTKLLKQNFGAILSRTTTKESIKDENGKDKKITKHQDFYIGIKIKNDENNDNNKNQIDKTIPFNSQKTNSDTLQNALLDYLKTIPKDGRIRVSDLSFLFTLYINIGNKEKELGYSDILFLKSLESVCKKEFATVSEFLEEVEKLSDYLRNDENIINSYELKYFKTSEYYTKESFDDMGITLIDAFDFENEHYYKLQIPKEFKGESAFKFSSYFSIKAIPITQEEFESKKLKGGQGNDK